MTSPSQARPRLRLLVVLAWIGLVLLLVALDRTTAALMVLLLGMALPLVFARSAPPEDNLLALLLALGAGVVAGTELVFLRDFLAGGDWYRMNTLFKFSVPAWLLLGIACGVMLPRLWHELSRLPGWVRRALAVGVGPCGAGRPVVPAAGHSGTCQGSLSRRAAAHWHARTAWTT